MYPDPVYASVAWVAIVSLKLKLDKPEGIALLYLIILTTLSHHFQVNHTHTHIPADRHLNLIIRFHTSININKPAHPNQPSSLYGHVVVLLS